MDLNHIELPAFAIADLYRSSLVELGDQLTAEKISSDDSAPAKNLKDETDKQEKWLSLGDNRKNILLIVDHKDVTHLPDEEFRFLMEILTACKLGIADISLINLNNYPGTDYKQLAAHFKCRTVLLFGVEPVRLGLPMNFPHFQQQAFANITYLFSPALTELENDKLLKSKLWVCLKRIFGI